MLNNVLTDSKKLGHIFDFFNEQYSSFEDLPENPSKKVKITSLQELYKEQEFPKAVLTTNSGSITIYIPQDYHGSINIEESLCINLKFTFGDCSVFGVQSVLVKKKDPTKEGLMIISNQLSECATIILVN